MVYNYINQYRLLFFGGDLMSILMAIAIIVALVGFVAFITGKSCNSKGFLFTGYALFYVAGLLFLANALF